MLRVRALDAERLSVDERVDLVAEQIATYGEGQLDVTPEVLAWARAYSGLRDRCTF
jgi:hypothetical protein